MIILKKSTKLNVQMCTVANMINEFFQNTVNNFRGYTVYLVTNSCLQIFCYILWSSNVYMGFKYPHNKKSSGVKCCDLAGYSIANLCPIQRAGNTSSKISTNRSCIMGRGTFLLKEHARFLGQSRPSISDKKFTSFRNNVCIIVSKKLQILYQ